MTEEKKLDRDQIRQLLREADEKWYAKHALDFDYNGHLDFVAAYIVKHYNKEKRQKKETVI